jgi:hypothetical protein
VVGCKPGSPALGQAPRCDATTESIRQTIFAPLCATGVCHSAARPALFLDLESPGVVERLSGAASNGCLQKTLVVPGDPEASYLIEKVVLDLPGCGIKMPQGLPPLTDAELACLRSWIAALPPAPIPDAGASDAGDAGMDATSPCPTGQALCGDACVDPQADNAHCGACGNACAGGTACSSGRCECVQPGQALCGGKCVVTATDSSNCGGCGVVCGGGSSCAAGRCACPGSMSLCGGACVDTGANVSHCGGCGKACATGQTCNGACACPSGLTLCSAACVDLVTDADNCGMCGKTCRGQFVCANGACAMGCPSGTTNCNGSCVDTRTSSTNCGACGRACASGQSCVNGSCGCPAGTTLCGSGCVNLAADSSNCGACGTVCSGGTACTAGSCGCGATTTVCGSSCVDVKTDPANCGACGRVCPSGSACSAGSCGCGAGQTLCGSSCVNTATDPLNCGACGRACPAGQGCVSGACSCGAPVSFAAQVQPIFNASCNDMGCHAGMRPAEALSLETGKAFAELVNVTSGQCSGRPLVKPGAPAGSYLMDKLLGANLCMGSQMPKAGQSLPSTQIDLIRNWICQGAPNN